MPILSMFYGVLVYMYAYDNRKHHRAHVHVEYAEFNAVVAIDDDEILEGELPRAKMKLLQAWMEIHRDELAADWKLSIQGLPPQKIDPLK